MSATEIGTLATAVFTALAALAALLSVRQGQRLWRSSLNPELHPQILWTEQGTTDLVVLNSGGGMARGVVVGIVAGGQRVQANIGDGFMRGGQKVHIHCDLPHDEDAECVVLYRSLDESLWTVARDGTRRRLRKGPKGPVTGIAQAFARFYPQTPYGSLPMAPYQVALAD